MVVFSNLSIRHIDISNKQLRCQSEANSLFVMTVIKRCLNTEQSDSLVRLRGFKLIDMVSEPSQNIVIHLLVIRL